MTIATTKTIRTMYVEITVRRPNGTVETVRHPTLLSMSPNMWTRMVKDTYAAGRGTCLSYDNKVDEEQVPMTLREQREAAAAALATALDRYQDAMDQAIRTSIGNTGPASQAIEAAERDIAEFDAAHPEIIAEIKAERAARAANHMWD